MKSFDLNFVVNRRAALLVLVLALVLAGCSQSLAAQPTLASDLAATQAAETVNAQQTLAAASTATRRPLSPTPTAVFSTLRPSSTPMPTFTPVTPIAPPGATAAITLDPALAGCDLLRVVKDVTIPEGLYMAPGTTFTKTWRLQNSGTCTWLSGLYELVFDSGEQLNGPLSVKLPANVLPGEMVDVSVNLKAPDNHGRYRGFWKLRNANGWSFGQDSGLKPFYVDISVGNTSVDLRYDFLGFFCQAEWKIDGKSIPCIGKDGDPDGFVRVLARPVLEDGSIDDEAALLTNPPAEAHGYIMGIFPEFTVIPGDHFMAVIGCEHEATRCDVTFELNYQIGDGPIQNYAHWKASYDEKFEVIDIDLKDLGRTKLRFVLTVRSNGGTDDNRALWLKPRIKYFKPAATPVPSATPRP